MEEAPGTSYQNAMDQRIIWDFYQNKTPGLFDDNVARLGYLVRQLKPPCRVLNIGIGNGLFERLASIAGHEVVCLDPSTEAIERLKREIPLEAYVGVSSAIPLPNENVDAVVASELLEHLKDNELQSTLCEIRRVLKPQGSFLGTVPHNEKLEANMVLCPHCGARFHRWGHERAFTIQSIGELLGGFFEIQQISRRKFVPWRRRSSLYKLSGLLKVALVFLGLPVENTNIFFLARKRTA